jgi:hypothetical protein
MIEANNSPIIPERFSKAVIPENCSILPENPIEGILSRVVIEIMRAKNRHSVDVKIKAVRKRVLRVLTLLRPDSLPRNL